MVHLGNSSDYPKLSRKTNASLKVSKISMPNYFEIAQKFRLHGPLIIYALVCCTKRLINRGKFGVNPILENQLNILAFLLIGD